jgi:hypothetical protein
LFRRAISPAPPARRPFVEKGAACHSTWASFFRALLVRVSCFVDFVIVGGLVTAGLDQHIPMADEGRRQTLLLSVMPRDTLRLMTGLDQS